MRMLFVTSLLLLTSIAAAQTIESYCSECTPCTDDADCNPQDFIYGQTCESVGFGGENICVKPCFLKPCTETGGECSADERCVVAYWWAEDLDHPGRFRFFEAWEDQPTFDAHRSADYEHEFMNTQIPRAVGASATQFALSGVKSLDSEVPADEPGAGGAAG